MESGIQPVDQAYLEEMSGGDTSFLTELFDTFQTEVRAKLPQLEESMRPFQGQRVYAIAHSFIGSAECLGARGLSGLARELETQGKQNQPDQAATTLEQFKSEFARVEAFFGEYLK